jgi:hypothetical protein
MKSKDIHGSITPRDDVRWFAVEMETKLRANDHKGHWRNCDFPYLDRRLDEEIKELKSALSRLDHPVTPEQRQRVIAEAADVANFAMMIADNARRLLNPHSKAPSDGE